ncbi:hypothetical protein L195_g063328, partial [Trifolium pratense]
ASPPRSLDSLSTSGCPPPIRSWSQNTSSQCQQGVVNCLHFPLRLQNFLLMAI